MGKKTKQGKERLDKFYHLAKDQGYRARSAFKLIQLARKSDFLSKATICIDLCAAPGGWSQVAQRNMPAGSKILAIDLMPIKPLHGVTCIQSDITTEKCRNILRKELNGRKADVVLHDGAPNVGAAWAKDAYGQAELTLFSMKLACEHLRPGGTFVTKVFRSADYNSLLWVFNQLYTKVEATKPTASRNVSAEIFVLCSGFKAGKIDPRFFDPKWVFMETVDPAAGQDAGTAPKKPAATINEYLKSVGKKHRGGYEPGDDLRITSAKAYFEAENPAEVLVTHHRISLEVAGSEEFAKHTCTTDEIRELCADLKVLGKKDLTTLLKWRMKILREKEKEDKKAQKEAGEAAKAAADSSKGSHESGAKDGTAKDGLQQDIDEAIAGMLDADGAAAKASKDAKKDDQDEADDDEELENELDQMVEKRRREERRDKKKTMERQKQQDMRRKMSLGASKYHETDQSELFKSSKNSVEALEDDNARLPESDAEEDADDEGGESESDSDEGLDRIARMEVDLAVGHELRKARLGDKYRTKMQRKEKKKKETRRQKVMAAWAGEFSAFNDALEQTAAAEHALRDKDDDDDDDDDDDSEDDLKTLRKIQDTAAEGGEGGLDPDALQASLDGPPKEPTDDEEVEEEDTNGKAGAPETSQAIVPAEVSEEMLRAQHRANRWFSQDIFQSIQVRDGSSTDNKVSRADAEGDVDEDGIREVHESLLPQLPMTDKEQRKLKRKKMNERLEQKGKKVKEEDKGPVQVAPLEPPKPLVPQRGKQEKPSDPRELAETMALGSLLVDSKKSRMEIIDAAYNRWAFDRDYDLPEWFTEEEEKSNKPELPISKELMNQFRAKLREINARPIRKVAEAKARKKKRLQKRLEKLRSTAMSLTDQSDMTEGAKARQMRKAINKLAKQDQRQVQVVAVKKGGGGRTDQKKLAKGAKVKVVDKRMKSDRRGQKKAAKRNPHRANMAVKKQAIKKGSRRGAGSFAKAGGGKKRSGVASSKRDT